MFGLFKSLPFSDPQLGGLRRSRGVWRGALLLHQATVPLMLSGSRTAPDPEALDIARSIASNYSVWRATIERALFEHYAPYAEAVIGAKQTIPSQGCRASLVRLMFGLTNAEFIQVASLDGELIVEIGYRVVWDEEHTVGARLWHGQLVELCGSVLVP